MKYLNNLELYLDALKSTYDKRAKDRRIYNRPRKNQPSLQWLEYNKNVFLKKLVKEVIKETFEFDGAKIIEMQQEEKVRLLGQFSYKDFILLKVLNESLTDLSQNTFSKTLYSYRKGYSREKALDSLSKFIKLHLKQMKEKKYPLYVYKADISRYGDSIPLDEKSDLWPLLKEELKNLEDKKEAKLIEKYYKLGARMKIINKDNFCFNIGMIFGSPICNYTNNLYLNDLDKIMEKEGFYARYGDDLLLVHHDFKTLKKLITKYKNFIKKRRLQIKEQKEDLYLFSGAGFKSAEYNLKGKQSIRFLGYNVLFNGEIELPSEKVRMLLKDLDKRCKNLLKLTNIKDKEKKAVLLTKTINNFLDTNIFAHKYFSLLTRTTNSRSALKHIDYLIVRRFLYYLTQQKSVRAFREIPYKKIREVYGLKSLVVERNKN